LVDPENNGGSYIIFNCLAGGIGCWCGFVVVEFDGLPLHHLYLDFEKLNLILPI